VGRVIGASRPKVNAAFTLLQSTGAIVRKGTMLTCDTNILQSIADME
jgi:CRP/FNR family transcriptional regulator, cyclic AMP receptor protein